MGNFAGHALRVEYIDGIEWKVIEQTILDNFRFVTNHGEVLIPDDGFITDFASVPAFLSNIIPRTGKGKFGAYGPSCVIHDYLYVTGKIDGKWVTRKYADDIFVECNNALGVSGWVTRLMYHEIRLWGSFVWYSHKDGRP